MPEIQPRFAGSLADQMRRTLEGYEYRPFLQEMAYQVESHPNIKWWPDTKITRFCGNVGNFRCRLESSREKWEVEFGAVVIATGGREYSPREYLFRKSPRVMTQIQLERFMEDSPNGITPAATIVMIQCVGSREPEHPYCSRVCCGEAIKNAITLKEMRPQARIFILYRDIRTYGFKEIYYKKARDLGVQFIRYEPERKPEVRSAKGGLLVSVFDQNLGATIKLKAEYVILSAGIRPDPMAREIANLMKLPIDADGFFMEAHMKLRPLDFRSHGFFLCGLAHSPKFIEETIAQAQGAAARALAILAQKEMYVGGAVAIVNQSKCIVCLTCVRTCPYNVPIIDYGVNAAYIDPAACQGCGLCASECPAKAITLQNFTDAQIIAQGTALAAG